MRRTVQEGYCSGVVALFTTAAPPPEAAIATATPPPEGTEANFPLTNAISSNRARKKFKPIIFTFSSNRAKNALDISSGRACVSSQKSQQISCDHHHFHFVNRESSGSAAVREELPSMQTQNTNGETEPGLLIFSPGVQELGQRWFRASKAISIPTDAGSVVNGQSDYLIKVGIGSPKQEVYVVMDTGSNISGHNASPAWPVL
ncbi:hypothetical protein LWI28_006979 [Acer negundo]|uniref:Peptidase A1 domain-containing protein n=1 Tax=Acer negundo TaxID=4023 RepID=A0AAD5ICT0_ACENE|nr:hypothetical protein LWI28_006979 [Acer negundo]